MDINICVIGLGYVGLPLAVEFSKKYNTFGYDKSVERIKTLKKNIDSNYELSSKELKNSKIKFSNSLYVFNEINFFVVTVPTPIDKFNYPDIKLLKLASHEISKFLKKDDIVVYESTVYPGLTEEVCIPILEKGSGLKVNQDFGCGYSPERINPGDKKYNIKNIKKIVSGSDIKTLNKIYKVYNSIIKAKIHKAQSIKVAEAAKVIENTQRDLNIALANELSQIFNLLDINTKDVLEAAATKWNFHKYEPGLVGGHCIGVDPYYLTYKAKKIGYKPKIILSGRKLNDDMSNYVANRTNSYLSNKKSKILILGCTFKQNCNDIRNSKVFDLWNRLKRYGHKVEIFDPFADSLEVKRHYNIKILKRPKNNYYNCIILAVNHEYFRKKKFKNPRENFGYKNSIIFDLKSFYKKGYSDYTL